MHVTKAHSGGEVELHSFSIHDAGFYSSASHSGRITDRKPVIKHWIRDWRDKELIWALFRSNETVSSAASRIERRFTIGPDNSLVTILTTLSRFLRKSSDRKETSPCVKCVPYYTYKAYSKFNVHGCVHRNNIIVYKSQNYAHVTEIILSDNCSTCFGRIIF